MKSVLCALLMVACTVSYAIAQDQPGLNAGIKAPDFTATNHLGKKIQLSQFYKNGPVVLVFYRGGWCPYCNLQLNDLQSKINEFNTKNATIIAVSIDKASKSAETANKNNLDFDVIGNPGGDILKAYDLVYQVPDDLAKKYKECVYQDKNDSNFSWANAKKGDFEFIGRREAQKRINHKSGVNCQYKKLQIL